MKWTKESCYEKPRIRWDDTPFLGSARKVAEFGAVKRVTVLSNKHCDTSQELPEAAGYYDLHANALRASARVVDLKNRRRGLSPSPYPVLKPIVVIRISDNRTAIIDMYWERIIVVSIDNSTNNRVLQLIQKKKKICIRGMLLFQQVSIH